MPQQDFDDLFADVFDAETSTQAPDRLLDEVFGPSPLLEETDEALAAQFGLGDLGPPGMRETGARFDIGGADNPDEKILAFKRHFPDGEMFKVPAGPLYFRETPQSKFKLVDAPFLSGGGREVINDVVEFFAPDIGAITAETGAAIGAKFLGKTPAGVAISLLPMLASMFGEVGSEAVEEFRGLSDEELTDVAKRAAVQGGTAGLAGPLAERTLRGATNVVGGRGLIAVRTGAKRAQQATQRLGLGQLPVNIVASSPIVRRMGGQAQALMKTISEYIDDLETGLARTVRTKTGEMKQGLTLDVVERAERREQDRIVGRVLADRGKTSFDQAGTALREGVAAYDLNSLGRVDFAYKQARKLEEPQFNLRGLKAKTEILAEGTPVGLEGTTRGPRPGDTGFPFAGEQAVPGGEKQIQKFGAAAQDAIDTIRRMDPNDPRVVVNRPDGSRRMVTVVEQLRRIRSNLADEMIPAPGELKRETHRTARGLYRVVSETIRDIQNTNKGFRKRWRNADRMAQARFATREKLITVQAAKTDTPANLAERLTDLTDTRNIDQLKVIKRVLPSAKFRQVADARAGELLRDPTAITKTLADANPQVLQQLFTAQEVSQLRQLGRNFDALAASGLSSTKEQSRTLGRFAHDLLRGADEAQIEQLVDILNRNGGKNGPAGRALRAGLIDDIFESSIIFEKGADRVDFTKLRNITKDLKERGALRILTTSDLRLLDDARRIQDLLRLSPDAGTSIQAAEAVAGLRTFQWSAIQTVLENFGVGRLFTSPGGIAFLTGIGRPQRGPSKLIGQLGAMTGQLVTDAREMQNVPQDILSVFGLTEPAPEPPGLPEREVIR